MCTFINYTPPFCGILHFDSYANKALLNWNYIVSECVCVWEREWKREGDSVHRCVCVNNNISLMNEYIESLIKSIDWFSLTHTHTKRQIHTSPFLCRLKLSCPSQTLLSGQTDHYAVVRVTAPLCIPLPGNRSLWQWWRILTVGFWYKSSLLFSFLVFLPSSLCVSHLLCKGTWRPVRNWTLQTMRATDRCLVCFLFPIPSIFPSL